MKLEYLNYYTAIIFLSVFSMVIMLLCVGTSNTLARKDKTLFRILFMVTAVCAICEWAGISLQGTGGSTRVLHIAVKVVELSTAPSIGFLISWVIAKRNVKPIIVFLAVHAAAECMSGVWGCIFYVDANSSYMHAGCYWIYVAAYSVSIAYCALTVVANFRKYQYNGKAFIILIAFLISGIALQMYDSRIMVDYMVLAIASIILYVISLEMIQQNDELTELLNRRGYENYTAHIEDKCVILFFDVDKFKSVNDQYGHQFGDFCLKSIGTTIRKVYSKYGKCFRIGGDEFCVVLTKAADEIEPLNTAFFQAVGKAREREKRLPHVSVGYAYCDPENGSVQDAVAEADKMMYIFKEKAEKPQ